MHQPNQIWVAVIIPHAGRLGPLIRSIESVKSQTFKNIVVFVSNDKKNERAYAPTRQQINAKFPELNVNFVQSRQTPGAGATRNAALHAVASSGKFEYVAFLDDDDEWCPCKLETQVNFMLSHHLHFSHHDYVRVSPAEKSRTISTSTNAGPADLAIAQIVFGQCLIATPTVMLKLVPEVPFSKLFSENMALGEDHRAWVEFLKITKAELGYLPFDGAMVHLEPDSVQRSRTWLLRLSQRLAHSRDNRRYANLNGIPRPSHLRLNPLLQMVRALGQRLLRPQTALIAHICRENSGAPSQ